MAKHFTAKDLERIVYLKEVEDLSHKEIAIAMNRLDKAGAPAARSIMKQYKKAKLQGMEPPLEPNVADALAPLLDSSIPPDVPATSPTKKEDAPLPKKAMSLNEMSRRERVDHLKAILPESPRGKFLYNEVFDVTERALFEDEYFRILEEEESFTAAEEGVLFMAIVHWTLQMRAMKRDRKAFEKSVQNGYKGADQVMYSEQWTREADLNAKKYESLMKSLKLSRSQRLESIKRIGTSFLDYAERASRNNEQEQIAEEILALEHASEEEFIKLQKNGWMIGGGMPNNSECLYEASETLEKEEDVQENQELDGETES